MGYKFTSICCNWASLTTVHEPEDQGVSITPSPLFSSQHVSENSLGPDKTLVSFSFLEKQIPSAFSVSTVQKQATVPSSLPGDFHTASAGAATAEGISSYFIPGRLSGHEDLHSPPTAQGMPGQEAEEPLCQATLSPAELNGEGLCNLSGEPGNSSRVCLRPNRRHTNPPIVCLQAYEEGLL